MAASLSYFSVPLLLCVLANAVPAQPEPLPTIEDAWFLEQKAILFSGPVAGQGFEDLEGLKEIIGDARIVGLGECTHGTREVFQMKHRITEFLATEMGFTIFSIEASTPEAYKVSDYVVRGNGDPRALIGGMYFWTWNTEEVLDMVRWMREFNKSGRGKIEFTGFDMQTPDVAMKIVEDFVARQDSSKAKEIGEAYEGVKKPPGSRFGVATLTFPVEDARGKRVRYTGFIKTKDVTKAKAGLWWRIDGEDRKTLGFDNMSDRGPMGTTEWTEYAIEMDVPEDAVNINFGVLLSGKGTAWFDGLSVTLDDEPYDTGKLDLDFEGQRVNGYSSNDEGYRASMDDTEVQSGKQSLRLKSLLEDTVDAEKAAGISGDILSWLEASREELIKHHSAREVDWAIHNARIVDQCMRMRTRRGGNIRDASMAENVAWILDQNPDAKIVLWAHNYHVSRQEGAMGKHLAEMFGKDYLPVAFAAARGKYYAMGGDSKDHIHDLQTPPPGSIEAQFLDHGRPRVIMDLRGEKKPGAANTAWLREERPFRSIGAVATDNQFFPIIVSEQYDVLIYFQETTAARQLIRPEK